MDTAEYDTGTAEIVRTSKKIIKVLLFLALVLPILVGAAGVFWYSSSTATRNNERVIVTIPSGSSVRDIATLLGKENVIRSPFLFIVFARWTKVENTLGSGTYSFQMPKNLFAVLEQLSTHEFGILRVRVTIPEGTTNAQIANILMTKLPDMSREAFLSEAKNKEGYLFPDTYFFSVTATSGPIIATLSENFVEKTTEFRDQAKTVGKKWEDVVIMASLIEEEAATAEDRRIVSGILWKRIAIGMRLQLDASFAYLLGKSSSEITAKDLDLDSPYNTYRYKGLPPSPIANPGADAILAALVPTKNPYLYYLSDKKGIMHYAKTFDEHKINKARYLR